MTTYLTGNNITVNDGSSINSAFQIWYAINKTSNGYGYPGEYRDFQSPSGSYSFAWVHMIRYLGAYPGTGSYGVIGQGDSGWRYSFGYNAAQGYSSYYYQSYQDSYSSNVYINRSPTNGINMRLDNLQYYRFTDDGNGGYFSALQNGTEVFTSSQWNIGGCWGCVNGFPYNVPYTLQIGAGGTGGFRFYGRLYGGSGQAEGVGWRTFRTYIASYY